jgi:hypothetical protein
MIQINGRKRLTFLVVSVSFCIFKTTIWCLYDIYVPKRARLVLVNERDRRQRDRDTHRERERERERERRSANVINLKQCKRERRTC